jgi:hypothetical protein
VREHKSTEAVQSEVHTNPCDRVGIELLQVVRAQWSLHM